MIRSIKNMLGVIALCAVQVAFAVPARAPDFQGISHWINSPPLTMQALRGKVVLVDFWTYSCINCLRELPHLKTWYGKYHDKGLVIVGVHTPEFDFEKKTSNVERAVKKLGIEYPVAMDNDMDTWNAWSNRFWPALYLVDRQGHVVMHHYGEGNYEETENAIRQQLGMAAMNGGEQDDANLSRIGSPEMYFGSARETYMVSSQHTSRFTHRYQAPDNLPLNRFALQGLWNMSGEYAEMAGTHGEIRLHFKSGKLHMVASSKHPVTLTVTVDGKKQAPVTVQASKLYTLFDSDNYNDHIVTIKIPHKGFRIFTFTFG